MVVISLYQCNTLASVTAHEAALACSFEPFRPTFTPNGCVFAEASHLVYGDEVVRLVNRGDRVMPTIRSENR